MQNSYRAFRRSLLATGMAAALLVGCHAPDQGDQQAAAAKAVPPPAEFVVPICPDSKCGVLDSHGKVLVPFEHGYENVLVTFMKDHVLALKDSQWSLFDARSGQKVKDIATDSNDVYSLPGNHLFGFKRDGKVGLMDEQGKELQPPRYDNLFEGGEKQYIGYELGGKNGLIDLQGKVLTEPLYDSVTVREDFDRHGGLVNAERGDQEWVVSLKDGTQKQVEYKDLSELVDGHMVASNADGKNGLVDAKGDLTIPLKYDWLGTPNDGVVAFRETSGQPCGYLDYQGKVVIAPKFADCQPFGKHGALAKPQPANADDSPKYGVIGHDGQWLTPPTYSSVYDAGRTLMGLLRPVPGFAAIAQEISPLVYNWGIYDTDHGRELIAPKYHDIGVLTPDRLVFSDAQGPQTSLTIMGNTDAVPAVGVMDASGKVLVQPSQFVNFELDKTGRYLRAQDGAGVPHFALYDLDGHQLIPPQWEQLDVDLEHGVIVGIAVDGVGDDASHTLRAVYDLQGKPLFQVKQTTCGAEQLVDGSDKVIWPQDPTPFCPKTPASPASSG